MNAKSHLALEVMSHFLQKLFVICVLKDMVILIELCYNLQETKYSHVSYNDILFRELLVIVLSTNFIHQLELLGIMELPD